jgi:endonuclease-3
MQIVAILRTEFPDAHCRLNFRPGDALQLLVATILSAQCTDDRVNLVTADLFGRYKTAADYAAADPAAFEQQVRSTGFFRNKTRSILGAAKKIVEDFGGQVPDTMDELLTLPGVARKTANVVLSNVFGRNEGVAVDTHVQRLAGRLRLSDQKTPEKIERDLMALLPQEQWGLFSHLLIFHGRRYCTAQRPDCEHCPLARLCPSAGKV